MSVKFGSFNVFGIGGKDVAPALGFSVRHLAPADPELSAIGFQEVWTEGQVRAVVDAYCGAGAGVVARANVDIWRLGDGAWRCLVPRTPAAVSLPKSSGLALCVRGAIKDSFFVKYRGGSIPDSLANKGVLCALVVTPGQKKRAVLNTHMHDYSNDRLGTARFAWLDTLISCVRWIQEHWRAPKVLLGDFNIDSIGAYDRSNQADFRCYQRLINIGMDGSDRWYDVNARVHKGKPIKTNATVAIDHHLLGGETVGPAKFASLETPHSDHRLTISEF